MVTTVTGKNQVTIPAEIVRGAHIQLGTQLDWTFDDKKRVLRVRILPSRGDLARQLLGAGRKYTRQGDDPIAELIAERVRDDDARNRCLGGE